MFSELKISHEYSKPFLDVKKGISFQEMFSKIKTKTKKNPKVSNLKILVFVINTFFRLGLELSG